MAQKKNDFNEADYRLALHEYYRMELQIISTKAERIRKLMTDVTASSVSIEAIKNNSLLQEDHLGWLPEDADLYVMSITRRPKWVSKFE
jgi:hypothetical protein